VKCFFDTSVLVPVFIDDHEHHERSLARFAAATLESGCCSAHGLAEVYASLTRIPGRNRLSGEQVLLFLHEIKDRLTVVALDGEEYLSTIHECATNGILGGALYDALLAACALKAKADILYTWNVQHFNRLGPEVERRVRRP
jgi:predicted nucleic acid-binding protein